VYGFMLNSHILKISYVSLSTRLTRFVEGSRVGSNRARDITKIEIMYKYSRRPTRSGHRQKAARCQTHRPLPSPRFALCLLNNPTKFLHFGPTVIKTKVPSITGVAIAQKKSSF
jgi:hypothetical protein